MSLFAADPPPSPALAAFTASAPVVVASAPSRPPEETARERRERLRDERRALVSALSRVTGRAAPGHPRPGEPRDGRRVLTAASAAQLEKGNALLGREAARRR